ncbi:helix-turn-helix domain-containing protein [Paraburkholderia sp. DHOC27]|uniref:winged helix-turn-helix transcriptional regulator n=1 Tax=Paraburkholderia sp. DHOC27 TaxID=2303330 RepID=UPI000E3C507A|nr:helix-turn-helix domain-containing protein [Paraburkholderia sp. DHOC27]RFU49164.1 transcriptional regulator [Paraburkholderia sp. DHOC27]
MYRKRFDGLNCSIARALDEVGEWWTLLIVRECTQGRTRFDEFQSELGIARNVLTVRLERLIQLGILERFPLAERANTFGYRLTDKGEALYPVLVALIQWGDKWLSPNGQPPIKLVEDSSGQPVEKVCVRSTDGKALTFRDVRYTPGPGATATTYDVIKDRNERVLGCEADEPSTG